MGGLLKVLPKATLRPVVVVDFEVAADAGPPGLLAVVTVTGRFRGTAFFLGDVEVVLDLEASAAVVSISSSTGTSESMGSSILAESRLIRN